MEVPLAAEISRIHEKNLLVPFTSRLPLKPTRPISESLSWLLAERNNVLIIYRHPTPPGTDT